VTVLERIKKLRDERGWSDYRLAKEADLSQTTLSNLYKRGNTPTIPTLEMICGAFGITLTQFFSDGDEIVSLSVEQRLLLEKWQLLSPAKRGRVMAYIEGCLTD
jgi:transcriptional regulator with XRE-family HTH domain